MRIIARRTLREFVATLAGHKDQPAVKAALDAWFDEVSKADWTTSADLKRRYATASIVNAERIVFNIKGNDYRLVVAIDFEKAIVWIKWIGTHKAYDKIDVTEPIRTEADHNAALAEVERLWGAKSGTPDGDRLDLLATLIDAYEARTFPMDPPDPIEAIQFRMEQLGLTRKDLEPLIGTRARVAEVMNRKRSLSIDMI
eukprot:gene37565-50709_t